MWLLVVAQMFCVLICVGLTPRAEIPWQLVVITPDTRENSDECTIGRAQGTPGWRMSRVYSALHPSASSLPLLSSCSKAPHSPDPRIPFFRITPSA